MIYDKKNKYLNVLYYVSIAVAFVLFAVVLYLCFFNSVWCDEVFSLEIVKGSYFDIIFNTAIDVHPPLYYFILKLFTDIIGFVVPSVNVVMLSKIISISSLFILFYFSIFKLSKVIPKFVVAIMLLMIMSVSAILDFSVTIRMYGFAVLFVLVSAYYLIKIIRYNQKKDWIKFVLFFELAALTHYFALIAVGGMFVYLLIYTIANRKQEFWNWYKYLFWAIIIFVPWLVVFVCQFAFVSGVGFWISAPNSNSILSFVSYAFGFKIFNVSDILTFVTAIIVLLIYGLMFGFVCKNKEIEKNEKWIAASGMFVTIFLFFVGLTVSYIITPIFVERYINAIFAILCMSFAYVIYLFSKYYICKWLTKMKISEKLSLKIMLTAIMLLVSIFATVNIVNAVKVEKDNNEKYNYSLRFFEENKDSVFVCDYGRVQSVFEYSFDVFVEGIEDEDVSWWENVTNISHKNYTIEEIKNILKDGKAVILLQTNIDLAEFKKYNIEYNKLTELNLESGDAVDVIKLSLGE